MMALLFVLKQQNVPLALAEAKACVHGWGWWRRKEKAENGTVFFSRARKIPTQLALTRHIVRVLAVSSHKALKTTLKQMTWSFTGTYRVTLTKQTRSALKERELAALVSRRRVDLRRPKNVVEIVLTKKRAYVGLRVWENTSFEHRKAHKLPAMHPTAMHPVLARALVNLAAARTIHDPFCGAGGLLLEAGLAGARVSGADIDPAMVRRARANCTKFTLRPSVRVADATVWLPRVQAIVTDLPYGKNTKNVRITPLLEAFLERASTRRLVLGLPHPVTSFNDWEVRAHFQQYIHKTMTRHFYVLERSG